MSMEAAAAAIPVVFLNGAQSINLGTVAVHPALGFKRFQEAIAQRIGVAPHQISASLVRPRRARAAAAAAATELSGRRVPIDESSDLTAIARDAGESYVLAALRRPRRERRGRSRRGGGGGGDAAAAGNGGGNKKAATAPEKTILRRSAAAGSPMIVAASPERLGLELGFWDYETELRNLQRQRESYLLSTAAAAAAAGYYPYGGAVAAAEEEAAAVCLECEAAEEEGRGAEFHWCVRDAVTRGFRSPLGPIERPPKKRVEASA